MGHAMLLDFGTPGEISGNDPASRMRIGIGPSDVPLGRSETLSHVSQP